MTNNRPIKKLWELIDIQNWFAFDASLFSNTEGFPLIRIRDIKNSFTETKYKGVYKEDFIVRKWDILVGMDWEFKCYVWNWEDALLNQRVCRLIKNNGNIDMDFLLYGINSFLKDIEDTTAFVTVKHISSKQIKEIDFPLPPLATQQFIVAKLDETFAQIDEAIAATQANIDKTDELTKSVLDKVFEEGEWEKKSVWNIANIKSWKRLPKGFRVQDEKTEYPYIRVSDFWEDGTIDSSNIRYITKEVFDQISRYIITDQDLYISIAGTIWKTWIIPSALNWASLTENAIRLVYKEPEKIYNNYILYFTKSSSFIEQAWLATRAVAMPKLAISRLGNIQIPLPPLAKQQEIVSYLDHVFAQSSQLKEQYQKKLVELKELKASVLQSAFEGKLV